MERKHGGALLLQELEPKRLIGSLMSVATESGEDWVHIAFSKESAGSLVATDDGMEAKLVLARAVALSFVALLRIALAQFELMREQADSRAKLDHGIVVNAEASRETAVVVWPSSLPGVRWRNVEEPGQAHLELRADIATAIEEALVRSLAKLAAGPAGTSRP
ncbi:MAG TPA: hypothetical protein VGI39_38830 [Polyangiaceae bacterium]|jgi:hypothetical protein